VASHRSPKGAVKIWSAQACLRFVERGLPRARIRKPQQAASNKAVASHRSPKGFEKKNLETALQNSQNGK
jgi:hypothetical protein